MTAHFVSLQLYESCSTLMSVWLPRRTLLITHSSSHICIPTHISTRSLFVAASAVPALSRQRQSTYSFSTSIRREEAHPTSDSNQKVSTPTTQDIVVKPPLLTRAWNKVKHEAAHYWHGSKLLVSEVRISSRLQWKILQGETLTRRERRQVKIF